MAPIRKNAADWTPEAVARFWGWYASQPQLHNQYFSRQVGAGVVEVLALTGALRGKVLDYGCGPGYLLEYLLKQPGINCRGCDFSAEAVTQTAAKFDGRSNWGGATHIKALPAPYPDGEFDVVTCLETIEHLNDEQLEAVLKEMHRLAKPGGMVFFTTPHAENLDLAQAYCPFCDSQFHNVQHLRSFTIEDLRKTLGGAGFEVVYCGNLDFHDFMPRKRTRIKDWSLRVLGRGIKGLFCALGDAFSHKAFPGVPRFARRTGKGPHLCAVARRSA